jgi:hypothetical protein
MQIMEKTILFIFLLIGNFATAQEGPQTRQTPGLSDADLMKAKELFIKMIDSDEYSNNEKLNAQFFSLLPKNFDSAFLETDAGFRAAISQRLKDSKFKSVEDAGNWRQRMLDSETAIEVNNPEVFRLMRLANKEQLREIYKPEFERAHLRAGF